MFLDISTFISKEITKREVSFFKKDIETNKAKLDERIANKSVLVIGGAGTIGSSFIKAILPFNPKKLVVVDYSENGLTELTRELRSGNFGKVPSDYITYPFDFGGNIFIKLLNEQHFDIVACFAAHKHVRSEKDHLAIEAMIRNNVFNTAQILEVLSLQENKPEHFFSVSTDKAANPVNVMGASKMLMEKVLMAYTKKLKISTARFANVAFSNGSLLAGFIQRIMKKQPLSAPSDVKRYFVSPKESGELCLLACILGETKNIFFPKLSESQMMTFSDIAVRFLNELGYEPDYCDSEVEAKKKALNWNALSSSYPVYFFKTDTSGEKMFEEFYTTQDEIDLNQFNALGVVKNHHSNYSIEQIKALLEKFENLFNDKIEKKDIINLINHYLPNFSHIETGKNLDQRM